MGQREGGERRVGNGNEKNHLAEACRGSGFCSNGDTSTLIAMETNNDLAFYYTTQFAT
jgi:hypothetical protein